MGRTREYVEYKGERMELAGRHSVTGKLYLIDSRGFTFYADQQAVAFTGPVPSFHAWQCSWLQHTARQLKPITFA